jgi:type II secretory pathway pseudopilin PulG
MASKNSSSSGAGYDPDLLIDFVSGGCDEQAAAQITQRLREEPELARQHQAITRLIALMAAAPPPEAPAGLAQRTIQRVRTIRQTEALIADQQHQRPVSLSTFSMRELIAVAAVVVLMVALLVPSMQQARYIGMRSQCAANVGQIGAAMNHAANQHQDVLLSAPAPLDRWMSDGRVTAGSSGLFRLVKERLAEPDVFQCPCAGGQSFTLTQDMLDFPSTRHVGYSSQYCLRGPIRRNDPVLQPVAHEMALLADATPVFPGGLFRPDRVDRAVSDNHPDGGQNVLYLDWHVFWTDRSDVGVNGDNIWLIDDVTNYTGREQPASPIDSFLLPSGCGR